MSPDVGLKATCDSYDTSVQSFVLENKFSVWKRNGALVQVGKLHRAVVEESLPCALTGRSA
jgi:hypothetical protein